MNKKIIFSIIVVLILFSVINILINNALNEEKIIVTESKKIEESQPKPTTLNTIIKKSKKRKLIPDDPEKYGILVESKTALIKTQQHWDIFIQKALVESKVLDTQQAKQALKETLTSEEEFNEKMGDLDERIAFFEKEHNKNRHDEKTRNRLEKLYMLKSIANVTRDKVISPQATSKIPKKVVSEKIIEEKTN